MSKAAHRVVGRIGKLLRSTALIVGVAAFAAASASATPPVWTANSNESSVSTIDGGTGKKSAPHSAVAFGPDGSLAYIGVRPDDVVDALRAPRHEHRRH